MRKLRPAPRAACRAALALSLALTLGAAASVALALGLPAARPASASAWPGEPAAGVAAGSAAAGPALHSAITHSHAAVTAPGASLPVLVIGVPGLRWTDLSAQAAPALWHLAGTGSVGSLVVHAVLIRACPADAWLTLNAGAKALSPANPAARVLTAAAPASPCPALPAVAASAAAASAAAAAPAAAGSGRSGGSAAPTAGRGSVPQLPRIIAFNKQFQYAPDPADWGVLGRAAGRQCATAIGPGAAIALASSAGAVARYVPAARGRTRFELNSCPLTVADLGVLPSATTARGADPRRQAVRAADRSAAALIARAPANAIVVIAGLGDDLTPHLRAIIVAGPGFRAGELTAASTRRPGVVTITDLTTSVLHWRAVAPPASPALAGALIRSAGRGPLGATVRALTGQDTSVHVYRDTIAWFFWSYGIFEALVMLAIGVLLRGGDPGRARRRRGAYRRAGAALAALPAGTFLANLVPWPELAHPALLLYGMAAGWGIVIAAAALAGPWRRDAFASAGFVAAVTLAVIGADVLTGSHLQLSTPFGLSLLVGGRFYGIGNNGIGVYAVAGLLTATWAGTAALRAGSRRRAVAAAATVALGAVFVSGWPGFGAKVGGTIAMVPAFLLVLAALGGIRVTPRRGLVIAVSGLVLVVIFAAVNYLLPGTGTSDIGAFVGEVLHGGAGSVLQRKIHSNISSLTSAWIALAVPVVMAATGGMIGWPARLRLRVLADAYDRAELLRPVLLSIWLIGLLGWLADDSGVSVAGSALPFALPLVIALVTSLAAAGDGAAPGAAPVRAAPVPAPGRAG